MYGVWCVCVMCVWCVCVCVMCVCDVCVCDVCVWCVCVCCGGNVSQTKKTHKILSENPYYMESG